MEPLVCFVDAGFLKAEGAKGLGVPRRSVSLNAGGVVNWCREYARGSGALDLLRVYWYDGAFDASDHRFSAQRKYLEAIAATPGVQIRLGHLRELTPGWHRPIQRALENVGVDPDEFAKHYTFRPEFGQKGVDTLIVLDLVRLAQKRAYGAALLIAGDRDLAEAVRTAQDDGRRVIVAIPQGAGVARELRQLADQVVTLSHEDLASMLVVRSVPGPTGGLQEEE